MAISEYTLGIGRIYAVVLNNRVVDIVGPIEGPGKSQFDSERMVDITWRPDIKVGDSWPICSLAELAARQAASIGPGKS